MYITPSSNLLYNYEKILPEYMKVESKEVWMVYKDFKNLPKYVEREDIQIVDSPDIQEFTDVFMTSYSSASDEDPYGEMPEYYRDVLINYDRSESEYIKRFYIAKYQGKSATCAISIVKDKIALICFVGTIKEYRKKGLCKNLMSRILNDLKQDKIKVAFLQTEEGFIPEKIYSKIGFKNVCTTAVVIDKQDIDNVN